MVLSRFQIPEEISAKTKDPINFLLLHKSLHFILLRVNHVNLGRAQIGLLGLAHLSSLSLSFPATREEVSLILILNSKNEKATREELLGLSKTGKAFEHTNVL